MTSPPSPRRSPRARSPRRCGPWKISKRSERPCDSQQPKSRGEGPSRRLNLLGAGLVTPPPWPLLGAGLLTPPPWPLLGAGLLTPPPWGTRPRDPRSSRRRGRETRAELGGHRDSTPADRPAPHSAPSSRHRRRLEVEDCQRGQAQRQVVGASAVRLRNGPDASLVADVRASVISGVRVQSLAIVAAGGHANAVLLAHDRREITDDDHGIIGVLRPAKKGQDAVFPVMQLQPFVALPVEIDLVERRFRVAEGVEVADELQDALVVL